MPSRTEVHFHLLAGVDDGPQTDAETIELARASHAEGTARIVVTPHVRSDYLTDVSELPDRVREVEASLRLEGVGVSLYCGGELGVDMVGRLCQSELTTIAVGPSGRKWLLVETPFDGIDASFHAATEELRDRGFGVVLAHPERSAEVVGEREAELRWELERGSLLQVNAPSLAGEHGTAAEAAAVSLLAQGVVHAIASDAHSPERGPALERALASATAHGLEAAPVLRLLEENPTRLLTRGMPAALVPAG